MNYIEYNQIPMYQEGNNISFFDKVKNVFTPKPEKFKGGVYYVNYPDHKISASGTKVPLGHGAVITVDKNGNTQYYEYGRYSGSGIGNKTKDVNRIQSAVDPSGNGVWVRKTIDNATFNSDGTIDTQSLANSISRQFGEKAQLTFVDDANPQETLKFIKSDARDKNREAYSFLDQSCGIQAEQAINSGRSAWSKVKGVAKSIFRNPMMVTDVARSVVSGDTSPMWTSGVFGLLPTGRQAALRAQGYSTTTSKKNGGVLNYTQYAK